MSIKTILTTIVCHLLALSMWAGEPVCHVTHFDEFSGMAQRYVTQIVQDKQGMMWFATWNGLNRYDGYGFESFKSHVGDGIDMPSDRLRDLVVADDGHLLCRVEDRVFLFNLKTCQYESFSPQDEKAAMQMFEKRVEEARSHGNNPIMHQDKYGINWAIYHDGSIYYQKKGEESWTQYPSDIKPTQYLHYGTTDKEGNIWLRCEFGAYKLSFYQKPYTIFAQEKTSQVRSFLLDNQQRYWITTRDDATIRIYDKSNVLLGYLGRDGRLHKNYTSFGSPIYHLMQDSQGTFWFSSKPDGLYRVKENADKTFTIEHFKHDESNKNSLPNDNLYYTAEDQLGRLWIATFDEGICCVPRPQDQELTFLRKMTGLKYPSNNGLRVRQIHITQKGILLAATTSGLIVADVSKKNPLQIEFKLHSRNAKRNSSLNNNATMYVLEDSHHRFFVCTESGGINQIMSKNLLADELEFKHYNTSTGFPSDVALSAVEEEDHILVVSNNQLIQFYPEDNHSIGYGIHFWQEAFRFSDAIPLLLPDGRWLMGLQNGAFTIFPKDIRKSDFVPPIAITSISIQNGTPNRAVNLLDTLILSPSERNVTIHFSALDYGERDDIRYAFQMEGKDKSWNNLGKNHSATFLDLRPGTHTLRLRSTNSDGIWVDNIRTLTIIVKPTFWETAWAKLLYILLIALIVYAVLRTYRHITELNKKQKETHEAYLALLNAKHTERLDESEQQREPISQPKIKPEDDAFMQRAMKFIEEHIGDPNINIGDMAEATATSRSGLNRKMKSLLGVTPLDFIREARIRKACKMLADGWAVNDVAYACGFSDPKYFGKCFKAEIGKTPTEYKAENMNNM